MPEPKLDNRKNEMDFDGFLSQTKKLLEKGYTADVQEGRMFVLSPDGSEQLSILNAVYHEMTGKDPHELNAPDIAQELGISSELLDRLTEAQLDEDTQWPKYRDGLEAALGIK